MGPLRPGSGRFYRPRPQNDNTEASQQRLFVFAQQVSKPLYSATRAQNDTNTTVTARASEAWSIRQTEAAPSHQKHQPAVGLISCRHGYWHLAAALNGWGHACLTHIWPQLPPPTRWNSYDNLLFTNAWQKVIYALSWLCILNNRLIHLSEICHLHYKKHSYRVIVQ